MSYVVITNRGCDDDAECSPRCRNRKIERREVETFGQAIHWAHHEVFGCEIRAKTDRMDSRFDPFYDQVLALTEPGGTIGPLPREDMRIEIVPV